MNFTKKDKAVWKSVGKMLLKIGGQWVVMAWPMVTPDTTWSQFRGPYFIMALVVSGVITLTAVFGDSPLNPKMPAGPEREAGPL